jgi:hypothetical protein
MNPAQVHLGLNIFPPVLNVAAIVVMLIALIWRSHAVVRASLALMLLSALFTIPVYLSGEKTEHLVEKLEGVNEAAIDPHEDAAKFAAISQGIQGGIALAVLILFRNRGLAKWAIVTSLVVSLWATSVVFRTAYLGGKIKHPETQMQLGETEGEDDGGGRGRGRGRGGSSN